MSGLMLGAVISVKWNGLGFWLSLLMFSFLLFAFNKAKINSDIKFKSCDLRQASLVFILPFFLVSISSASAKNCCFAFDSAYGIVEQLWSNQ